MWRPDGDTADASAVIGSWLTDEGVRRALDVRRHGRVEHFNAEAYAAMVVWTTWIATVRPAEIRKPTCVRVSQWSIGWPRYPETCRARLPLLTVVWTRSLHGRHRVRTVLTLNVSAHESPEAKLVVRF